MSLKLQRSGSREAVFYVDDCPFNRHTYRLLNGAQAEKREQFVV